ncbi:MAG: hypothetical protein KJ905_01255, partial [Nanoarchaeota archaeon]|nr:hypothetical protein [Nanoarchaeota archaeon]
IKSLVAFSDLEEKISFNDLIPIPPFTIGVIPLGPITIPVIVYPQIGLDVGISGNIGELETGISQEVSFTAGLKYENGSWSPIADFSNEFDFDSPTIKIQNLDFRAFAGPTIKFPIYNVAGPYGSVPGFIGFETDEKGWVVSGGLEALVGIHAQIFGKTLADYSAKVFEMKKVVGEGGFVQETPGEPGLEGLEGKIAFVSNRTGEEEIWVMNADGSDQKSLTDPPTRGFYPVWSPNGNRIAFISLERGKNYKDIVIANSDGSGSTNITQNGKSSGIDFYDGFFPGAPSWSPDETKIAFHSSEASSYSDIYIINSDGKSLRYITKDHPNQKGENSSEHAFFNRYPRWFPNGKEILFTRIKEGERGSSIYEINSDGTNLRRITEGRIWEGSSFVNPVPSPDGTSIAFILNGKQINITDRNGFGRRIIKTESLRKVKLTESNGNYVNSQPSWSSK